MAATAPTEDPAAAPPPRARLGTAQVVAIAVGVVLVLFITVLALGDPGGGDDGRRVVGEPAPPVVGVDLDGQGFDLAEWDGDWVVVNFFATWCVPCVREHPELIAFADEHADGRARVVSVAFDDQPDDIRAFFAERGGDWPVLADDTGSIALEYGVRAVPESYLVAPDGTVVDVFISGVTAAQLDAAIEVNGGLDLADGPTAGGPDPEAGP